MIEELFKKNKIKNTKQRNLVYDIVLSSEEEATVKYIFDKCCNKVDLATIYRILELFINKELFTKNLDYEGTIYYTINSFKHEHYLNCIKCRKKEKIDFCPVEEMEQHIEKENGFQIINHNIELSGICHECQKKK